ncbi:hypothetical protein D8674_034910 [Pyrus ussuriensis x Pyrus communis]|uniref:Uncharacterized protein n=1 Tax=Pyrus ussuriensis x Pyrus communis TaxID=2448454 RepID=A0A5N5GPC7_9ROSA|nr:hypothetical protein D8674_034910 [Pyrus ussuriensis x Pyrus communis]
MVLFHQGTTTCHGSLPPQTNVLAHHHQPLSLVGTHGTFIVVKFGSYERVESREKKSIQPHEPSSSLYENQGTQIFGLPYWDSGNEIFHHS